MTVLEVAHQGAPIPKGRPRLGRGKVFTPPQTEDAEEELGWTLRRARPRDWPLGKSDYYALECHFFMPTFHRIDTDNLLKLVMDAGHEVLWQDDSQVVETHTYVVRGAQEPRTELKAWVVPSPHER